MNKDALNRLVVRQPGDLPRDDVYLVPPPHQLDPLRHRLPLGPAGTRMKPAQHVTDADRRIGHEGHRRA